MASPYPEKPRYTLQQAKPETSAPPAFNPQPARELSDDEFARTADLKQLHHDLLPEFNIFVIELYKLGMIPGWRALRSVEDMHDDSGPHEQAE